MSAASRSTTPSASPAGSTLSLSCSRTRDRAVDEPGRAELVPREMCTTLRHDGQRVAVVARVSKLRPQRKHSIVVMDGVSLRRGSTCYRQNKTFTWPQLGLRKNRIPTQLTPSVLIIGLLASALRSGLLVAALHLDRLGNTVLRSGRETLRRLALRSKSFLCHRSSLTGQLYGARDSS